MAADDDEALTASDHIRDAVLKVVEDDEAGPFLIGDLLVIVEITTGDGTTNLLTIHNIEISYWKELGFLHNRLDSIAKGNFVLGEDVDEL